MGPIPGEVDLGWDQHFDVGLGKDQHEVSESGVGPTPEEMGLGFNTNQLTWT